MDQFGRPQFGDWMGIAQGLKGVNQDREEQEALAIAQKVAEDPSYKPEGVNPSVAWRGIVEGNKLAADKMSRESAALEMRFRRIKANREEFLSVLDKDVMSLRGVDDKAYVSAAKKAFKAHPNGIDIKDLEDGTVEVTYPNGQKSVRGDFTAKEIDQMIVNYRDPTAGLKQDLAWDEMIKEDNFQAEKDAAQLVDKDGKLLPYRGARVYDKNLKKHYTQYWRDDGTPASEEDLKKIHASGAMTSDGLASALKIQKAQNDLFGSMLNIQDKQLGIQGKQLDNAGKGIALKEKIAGKGAPGKDDLSLIYQDLNKNFGISPNQVDTNGKPFTVSEDTAVAARNYLRDKGYDARWKRGEDGGWAMIEIQKGALPMDANRQKSPRGTGLAGAGSNSTGISSATRRGVEDASKMAASLLRKGQTEVQVRKSLKEAQYTDGEIATILGKATSKKQGLSSAKAALRQGKKSKFASQYLNSEEAGRDRLQKVITETYGADGWNAVLKEAGILGEEKKKIRETVGKVEWDTLFGKRGISLPVQGKM